jgi:hypothetical protein
MRYWTKLCKKKKNKGWELRSTFHNIIGCWHADRCWKAFRWNVVRLMIFVPRGWQESWQRSYEPDAVAVTTVSPEVRKSVKADTKLDARGEEDKVMCYGEEPAPATCRPQRREQRGRARARSNEAIYYHLSEMVPVPAARALLVVAHPPHVFDWTTLQAGLSSALRLPWRGYCCSPKDGYGKCRRAWFPSWLPPLLAAACFKGEEWETVIDLKREIIRPIRKVWRTPAKGGGGWARQGATRELRWTGYIKKRIYL